jgi:hypothetical protein
VAPRNTAHGFATAVHCGRRRRASKVLTSTGGCGMLSKNWLVIAAMMALAANTPPKTTMAASSIQAMRRRVEGGRLARGGRVALM